jgi:hypothetical protein
MCIHVFFLVLMHTGYCSPTSSPPPSAIQELRATIQVLPPQDSKQAFVLCQLTEVVGRTDD